MGKAERNKTPEFFSPKDTVRRYLKQAVLAVMITASTTSFLERLWDSFQETTKKRLSHQEYDKGVARGERERSRLVRDYMYSFREFQQRFEKYNKIGVHVDLQENVVVLTDMLSMRFRGQDIEISDFEKLKHDLKENSIKQYNHFSVQSYYQDIYHKAEFMRQVAPSVKEVIAGEKESTIAQPRYIFDARIEKSGDLVIIEPYFFDQKEGKLLFDTAPLLFSHASHDSIPMAEKLVERIKKFQDFISPKREMKTGDMAYQYKEVPLPLSENFLKSKTNDFSSLLYGKQQAYLIEQTGGAFPLDDENLLRKWQKDGVTFLFYFKIGGNWNTEYFAHFSPEQIKKLGSLRFRHLESVLVYTDKQVGETVMVYPEFFAQFERTGNMDSHITVKGLDGNEISVGRADIGHFEYRMVGPYHYYDVHSKEKGSFLSDREIQNIGKEVASMEKLFGFEQGKALKRIIADERLPGSNGSYRSSTDTLAIFAERKMPYRGDILSTVRHEMFHFFDDRFDITARFQKPSIERSNWPEELEKFFSFYRASPRAMLDQLAEGSLDIFNEKIDSKVGHPWDNTTEFFASLVNSLFVKEPQKVFSQKDDAFLSWYLSALFHTLERLSSIERLAEAPIMGKVAHQTVLVKMELEKREKEKKK